MSLRGYSLRERNDTEIVCAYASGPFQPQATAEPAPWVVYGSFSVPTSVEARLVVLALNQGDAILQVGIFGPRKLASVNVTSETEQEVRSTPFVLVPGQTYQLAAKYELPDTVAKDGTQIAVVRNVSIG